MATVSEKMTAIADNIRACTGKTEPLGLDEMATGVNEIYQNGLDVIKGMCDGTITTLNIPDGTMNIRYSAFDSVSNLESVSIPNSVTSIGKRAFYLCRGLKSVFIGNGVTSIGDNAFYYCDKLESINIPASVTSIGSGAFYSCNGLKGIHITDIAAWCRLSFNRYDDNPLYCAHNLYLNDILVTELIIPNGVTNIGKYAFYYCTKLSSVVIPNSVTSIGEGAFSMCANLTDIYVPWAEGVVSGAPWGATSATIHYNSNI